MARYEEYAEGIATIKLGTEEIKIYSEPKDYEQFLNATAELKKNNNFVPMIKVAQTVIKKGARTTGEVIDDKGLEMFLWKNIKNLVNELTIAFGLATREDVEKAEKEYQVFLRKESQES